MVTHEAQQKIQRDVLDYVSGMNKSQREEELARLKRGRPLWLNILRFAGQGVVNVFNFIRLAAVSVVLGRDYARNVVAENNKQYEIKQDEQQFRKQLLIDYLSNPEKIREAREQDAMAQQADKDSPQASQQKEPEGHAAGQPAEESKSQETPEQAKADQPQEKADEQAPARNAEAPTAKQDKPRRVYVMDLMPARMTAKYHDGLIEAVRNQFENEAASNVQAKNITRGDSFIHVSMNLTDSQGSVKTYTCDINNRGRFSLETIEEMKQDPEIKKIVERMRKAVLLCTENYNSKDDPEFAKFAEERQADPAVRAKSGLDWLFEKDCDTLIKNGDYRNGPIQMQCDKAKGIVRIGKDTLDISEIKDDQKKYRAVAEFYQAHYHDYLNQDELQRSPEDELFNDAAGHEVSQQRGTADECRDSAEAHDTLGFEDLER